MDNKIGNIISELRKEKGLTQKELAKELSVSDKAVSRWETGKSFPDLDMLFQISKYFNISFNDLLQARVEVDDEDDHLVKDIINEFSEMNKKNSKRIKIILISSILLILSFIVTIIFINTYNRFKVYRIELDNSNFYFSSGVYVETKIKNTLYLGNLKLKNIELNNLDNVIVDIYIKENGNEKILYSKNNLDNINFMVNEKTIKIVNLNKYFDKIYLRLTIIDEKNNIKEYKSKLKFILDFTNSKIFSEDNSQNMKKLKNNEYDFLSTNDIIEVLLKNDFEYTNEKILIKRTDDYVINYSKYSSSISYTYEKDNITYRYVYFITLNELKVNIFDKNNTELENYTYDVNNDKVTECITGSCNNYKEALNILNKNILNLLKK